MSIATLAQSAPAPCSGTRLGPSPDSLRFAALAARNSHPVLIGGETGSGKTYLARLIHRSSSRSHGPFVSVNCASIPDGLFESEMFGCVRGAFTDARDARPGMFEAADRGTLFLDEIGEMPLHLQAKILTVLEEGTVRRLGATRPIRVDVRTIAASNRDLDQMVGEKRFRQDLFYRCAVLEHRVPSLRERSDELPTLILNVLQGITSGPSCPGVSDDALALLCAYSWPGNIRELENSLRQALVEAEDGVIRPCHLSTRVRAVRTGEGGQTSREDSVRARYNAPASAEQERRSVLAALCAVGGNRSRAARLLGMSRAALWNKMKCFRIDNSEIASGTMPARAEPARV